MHPLHDRERHLFLRLGSFLSLAAIALTPLVGTPAVPRSRASGSFVTSFGALLPEPQTTMMPLGERDPFAPRAADLPQNVVTQAVLLGTVPRAIIAIGNDYRVVAAGDAIAGVTVSAIDGRGVVLSDGSRIPLNGHPR